MSRDIKYTGILRLVLVCLLSVSCHQRETLHTGDLIFVGTPQDQPLDEDSIDSAISATTTGEPRNHRQGTGADSRQDATPLAAKPDRSRIRCDMDRRKRMSGISPAQMTD